MFLDVFFSEFCTQVPVAVIVERKIDPGGKESLVISKPGEEHSRGYPVKILKPKAKSNPKLGVPNVKIFRKENENFSVKKHLRRHFQKLEHEKMMESNFVDLVHLLLCKIYFFIVKGFDY